MPVKIIHTSDWHLGKRLYKESRHEEHVLFLNWLTKQIQNKKPDILIISGDIYDTPNPPSEAQRLFYQFISKIEDTTEVFVLAGNHDSSKGIMAPNPLLKENIHIIGELDPELKTNIKQLNIRGKKINIFNLPFFRTYEIEKLCKKQEFQGNLEEAITFISKLGFDKKSDFNILNAHHLFGHFFATGSEQTISLTGLNSIDCKNFESYDYLALGHIHKHQKVSSLPLAYYSGSPIPMRFSESNQKYVMEIALDDKTEIKTIEIPHFRNLLRVKCHKDELELKLNEIAKDNKSELAPYVEIELILDDAEYNLYELADNMAKKLNLKLISLIPTFIKDSNEDEEEIFNVENLNTEDLFNLFYNTKYNHSPTEKISNLFKKLMAQANSMEDQNEIP